MFSLIKQRFHDMRTISKLISGADKAAQQMGEAQAGAEHFLLSALDLPDGTAQRVFERLGADKQQFKNAIKTQYTDALNTIGVDTDIIEEDIEPVKAEGLFHNSKPSGQAVMKDLYTLKKSDKVTPLLSAHVLKVIANMQYSVAARALKTMGIKQENLISIIDNELKILES